MPRRTSRPPAWRRRAVSALLSGLLLVTGACTGEPSAPVEPDPSTTEAPQSVGTAPTLEAKPVALRVRVARVAGERLRPQQRRRLEKQVGAVLHGYFDAAFLAGEYPRSDFSGALAGFTPGASVRATSDRDLLTNAAIGPDTERVVGRSAKVRLDVLVPRRLVAGLTARFRLVFTQEPVSGAERRVTVRGRLMLSRNNRGRWQIFGYDVTRSSVPAAKG